MKKLLILLAMIIAFAFVLASCKPDAPVDNNEGNNDVNSGGVTGNTDNGNTDTNGNNNNGNNSDGDSEGDNQETEDHTHTFGEWVVTKEPTCTESGEKESSCSCGEKRFESVPPSGHDMDCDSCTSCGSTYSQGLEFWSYGDGNCLVVGIGSCNDADIIIPPTSPDGDKVVGIGESAFNNCSIIKSVHIPKTVLRIEDSAFENCWQMTSIVFGKGLERIGAAAFANCTSLTELYIPSNVTVIQGYYTWSGTFEGCTSLKKVTAEKADIGLYAFKNCTSLTDVTLGGKNIGEEAFVGCTALSNVNFRSGVEVIGARAFYECTLIKNITIPNTAKEICDGAFYNCNQIASLGFGSGLEKIGASAFTNCTSLTELYIPSNVTEIQGYYSFSGAFEGCTNLIRVTAEKADIGLYAFKNCTSLTDVALGGKYIGEEAFVGCTSLANINILSGVEVIGARAFWGLSSINSIHIPSNVKEICDGAFYNCDQMTSVKFESGLEKIGASAFANCTALTEVHIPASINEIQGYYSCSGAFEGCKSLKKVTIGSADDLTAITDIGINAFRNCPELTKVVIGNNVRSFGLDAFSGCANLRRLYYTGTSVEWASVKIENASYPLNVTPYFYSAEQPSSIGNYWYYNSNNQEIIWDVPRSTFDAQGYSEGFVDVFGGEESSYATTFYNGIHSDLKLMLGINAWETIHAVADPSYALNLNDSLISKKDLYKFALYDLLIGEESQDTTLDLLETSSTKFMLHVGNMYLGNPAESPLDLDTLKSVLDKDPSAIEATLKKAVSPTEIEVVMLLVSFADNAYEALESASQYIALSQIKSGYISILVTISNDPSNPPDLREAAYELVTVYQDSFDLSLQEFQNKTFINATYDDVFAFTVEKAADVLIASDKTGSLLVAKFTGKALRALLEPLKLDDYCKAYYQLKTAVGVEGALRKIIHDTIPDYMRYENSTAAENYNCAIDLYKKIVLKGFDYSSALLTAHMNSSYYDSDYLEEYLNMMNTLSEGKKEKIELYNSFDDILDRAYKMYYCD